MSKYSCGCAEDVSCSQKVTAESIKSALSALGEAGRRTTGQATSERCSVASLDAFAHMSGINQPPQEC